MSVFHLLRDSVDTGVVVAAQLFTMACEFLFPESDKC